MSGDDEALKLVDVVSPKLWNTKRIDIDMFVASVEADLANLPELNSLDSTAYQCTHQLSKATLHDLAVRRHINLTAATVNDAKGETRPGEPLESTATVTDIQQISKRLHIALAHNRKLSDANEKLIRQLNSKKSIETCQTGEYSNTISLKDWKQGELNEDITPSKPIGSQRKRANRHRRKSGASSHEKDNDNRRRKSADKPERERIDVGRRGERAKKHSHKHKQRLQDRYFAFVPSCQTRKTFLRAPLREDGSLHLPRNYSMKKGRVCLLPPPEVVIQLKEL